MWPFKKKSKEADTVMKIPLKVTYTDGLPLKRSSRGELIAQSPFDLNIPRQAKVRLDLGFSVDRMIVATLSKDLTDGHVTFADGASCVVFPPGAPVVVSLTLNSGFERYKLGAGDSILLANVLDSSYYELV